MLSRVAIGGLCIVVSLVLAFPGGADDAVSLPVRLLLGGIAAVLVATAAGMCVTAESKTLLPAAVGGAVGLALAGWVTPALASLFTPSFGAAHLAALVLLVGLPYLGVLLGQRIGADPPNYPARPASSIPAVAVSRVSTNGSAVDSPSASFPKAADAAGASSLSPKLLDTSVIIDGRIADLCETGFLDGPFIVPQFILHELQHIADSSDGLKRARGRRGLDMLHKIQKMSALDVRIWEDDVVQMREVDAKLVTLAKQLSGKIVTNDLNLNKVAELQGVRVLNINELCNALRPVVLPGETMRVFILKEGKEPGQGVAYLDDGTMIVVDNAKRWIGRNMDVAVTSVLQTTAGRMIFTRLKDESERDDVPAARGVAGSTGSLAP
ncbi:MAG: TRAM domain-containing protein [Nitrospiraceae bacterium]